MVTWHQYLLVRPGNIIKLLFFVKEGGVQARKYWKQVFEITVDPRVSPSGPNFWSGLETPDPSVPV